MLKFLSKMINFLMIILIWVYQKFFSPVKNYFFGPTCRFRPTCSQYALESFYKFPFPIAFYLTIKRILKCHPFNEGGIDPVPEKIDFSFGKRIFTFHSYHYEKKDS